MRSGGKKSILSSRYLSGITNLGENTMAVIPCKPRFYGHFLTQHADLRLQRARHPDLSHVGAYGNTPKIRQMIMQGRISIRPYAPTSPELNLFQVLISRGL